MVIPAYSGENRLTLEAMHKEPPASQAPPPKQVVYWQKALLWQTLGFLIVVVLTWSDAIFDLAHVILGLPHRELDINRTAVTTAVLVLLWMFSAYKIYLVVSRLSYLESFLHVCAWCRKIEYNDRWLSLEAHFEQKTGGQVSHGICPECSEKVKRRVQAGRAAAGD
jgi:hypothetical protein